MQVRTMVLFLVGICLLSATLYFLERTVNVETMPVQWKFLRGNPIMFKPARACADGLTLQSSFRGRLSEPLYFLQRRWIHSKNLLGEREQVGLHLLTTSAQCPAFLP
ncbi:MAG: hypothetical protein JWM11_7956 [Planctomycetaceae bacterium]|nr:hypothetical protein [Planctomycetaceae bacterium]